MKKNILSPSLLAVDFSKIGDTLQTLERNNVEYIHLDVMDGIFVPNISFGQPLIKSLRNKTNLIFDTHLMIKDPERYIESFIKAGSDIITIHIESTFFVKDVLQKIRSCGAKAGLSIKPNTKPESVVPYLEYCDMILVMTVEPGFGGQKLIPETLDNIKKIKEIADSSGYNIDIEADGGIDSSNIELVKESGANIIVAGSSVLGKSDITAAIKALGF
ncbi:MAG: ribulose-phosphate 3-epimerase [Ruminococcaceae bacterium]|nr:ribulose-phosphate 3-epimerase [Oscillospiraceae bacterium]